jgi:hypothetical protein
MCVIWPVDEFAGDAREIVSSSSAVLGSIHPRRTIREETLSASTPV